MAPKAAAPAAPTEEEEIELPEGLEVPEPPLFIIAAHIAGSTLSVEDESAPNGIREVEAVAPFLEKVKGLEGDGKKFFILEKEEVEGAVTEEIDFTTALKNRLDHEVKTRGRSKWNAAKKKAIAEKEAAENPPAEEEAPPPAEEEPVAELPFDICIILNGFGVEGEEAGSGKNELLKLQEGHAFDSVNLWTTILLSGEIIMQVQREVDDENAADTQQPEFVMVAKPGVTPDFVHTFYNIVQGAEAGSALTDATICVVPDCHNKAAGENAGDALYDAVAENLIIHMEKKQNYKTWAADIATLEIPALPVEALETRHYKRLMSSVDPSHHDVPLFLHCLTEQVTRTLDGCAPKLEDEAALMTLDNYLQMVHAESLTSGITPEEQPSAIDATDVEPEAAGEGMVLPFLDGISTRHLGHQLPGNISVVHEEHKILSYLRVPGYKRNDLPQYATYSAAQRSALRNRIYPFLPDLTPVETERMLLVHEFEKLLSAAQPERKWRLSERIYHEKIPKDLLVQTLSEAFRNEMFMNTQYYARHDCCLVALHYRALPGRCLWHAWKGDLFTDTASPEWKKGLFTKPSFNDWWYLLRGGGEPPKQVLGLDSRQYGYCNTVEKLVVPSEGSTILVSTFKKGIKETFPHPDADPLDVQQEALEAGTQIDQEAKSAMSDLELAAQKEPVFHPPAKLESKWSHVLKDGITFGITDDAVWEERRSGLQKQREDREAAEKAKAEAAAADPEDPAADPAEAPAEEAAPAADQTQDLEELGGDLVLFEDLRFGLFWLAFPDGARSTVRMHHERAFADRSKKGYSPANSRPGAALTYSLSTGQVIQVFSDASVCQSWPLALLGEGNAPPSLSLLKGGEEAKRRPAGKDQPHFYPGCAEDVEVSRTITAYGTLIRRLISGRIEICHADGTTSAKNPTVEEMQKKVNEFETTGGHLFEFLKNLSKAYSERHSSEPITAKPNPALLSAGLPGHWVVIRPDGQRVGRCPMPPPPVVEEKPVVDGDENQEAPPDEEKDEEDEEEAAAPQAEPQLIDLLGGYPVSSKIKGELSTAEEIADMIEYPINPEVSVAQQIDPHTLQKVITNAHSLLVFEDRVGDERVCLHADGTRVKTTNTTDGQCIVVEKEKMARITCQINSRAYVPNTKVTVDCADDTVLEVIPKKLNEKGELSPSDPNIEDLHQFSMNASVLLKRSNGSMLRSFGDGEVDIITGLDVSLKGEKDVLTTLDKKGMYIAKCKENKIVMEDPDQNHFVLNGDQSLSFTLAVSMGDELEEPKCIEAGVPYKHPHVSFLPLPEDVPPPRLIVVYGDGEAEELALPRVFSEAMRTAKADSEAVVLENEPMGPPMENCKCHTIFKAASSEAASIPVEELQLPPIVAGCDMPGAMGTKLQADIKKNFTEFRQFVEYPAISEELREMFYTALSRYEHWEFDHRAAHAEIGKGLDAKKGKDKKGGGGAKGGKDKGGKKQKGGDKGKRGSVRAGSSMSAEEEAAQKAAEDYAKWKKFTGFEHELLTLELRKNQMEAPTFSELLKLGMDARTRMPMPDEPGVDEAATKLQSAFRGKKARDRVEGIKSQQLEQISQEEQSLIAVSMTLNIDYQQLSADDKNEFKGKIRGILTESANVTPSAVSVTLSSGSVKVDAEIRTPNANSATQSMNQSNIAENVVQAANSIPGVKAAAMGELKVTSLEVGGRSLLQQEPVPTKPVEADYSQPTPEIPVPPRSKCKVTTSTKPVFSYFESEAGLQFLLDTGGLEPDRKIKTKSPYVMPDLPVAEEQKTPWNPRLVDEPEDIPETTARDLEEVPEVEDVSPGQGDYVPQETERSPPGTGQNIEGLGARTPMIRPERPASPQGPHPDKKSSKYDVYGHKKEPPKPVPQAYLSYNAEFLEIESAVDRRVRTASVAHKKNAAQAPSVSAVRKSGSFQDGQGFERATGVVGELRLPDPRDGWQLTSTMQGLGDPTKLVDVTPGICRFGPLRCGCVYRMAFFLRNLDVDTTRFNVSRVDSAFVNVHYAPQLLAPGMAAKIAVEIAAGAPAKVEQLVEVRVKAHVVQVPVTARIFEADEYDRLDAESMNLHGRHIGRLRKGGPVELILDEGYCRKVLGERYAGPPPEQLSWQQSQEESMISDGAPAGIPLPVH